MPISTLLPFTTLFRSHLLQQAGLKYARLRMPDPTPGYDSNNRGFVFVSFETREDYDAAQRYLEGRDFAAKLLRTAKAQDRKSTRLNSSHVRISYDVFC